MDIVISKQTIRSRPGYGNSVMVDVRIVYPRVYIAGNPQQSVTISRYYREVARKYSKYALHDLYEKAAEDYKGSREQKKPFHTYEADMTFRVPYKKDSLLSVYYEIYEFTGGAHGITTRYADTWNIKTGEQIGLSVLLAGTDYRHIIFREIFSQISQRMEKDKMIFLDGYQKNIFRYFDKRNFYLTPEGIAVYYPLYTIAPYAAGIVEFVIPYSMLKPSKKQ